MITSVNVSPIAFQASIDSTRLNMACKQISQSLADTNTEIPYVLSNNYRYLTDTSLLGICKAKCNGKVIYNNDDIMVLFYDDKGQTDIEVRSVPRIAKTTGNFASPLRFSLPQYSTFKKDDIIYEYSEFTNGVPSYGYNVFTGFLPFFGYNHEDSLVISESLANKAHANFVEKIYVPITEYTKLQRFYEDVNTGGYFPNIGQDIHEGIICCGLEPKTSTNLHISNPKNVKQKMLQIMKTLSVSDLINMNSQSISNFIVNRSTTKVEDGHISGIRIHRIKKNVNMIDPELQTVLENLCNINNAYTKSVYDDLRPNVGDDFAIDILRKHFIYADQDNMRHKINLRSAVYLIEFEVTSREKTILGDKLANTCANKGVISEIMPDELRPIAIESQQPIDLTFNPFGVFSRMNLGQLSEGTVGKNVMYCDKYIKSNPEKTVPTLKWLADNIISNLNDPSYLGDVRQLINNIEHDSTLHNQFVDNVVKHNLFIEAPQFAETNIDAILKKGVNPNETVLLKKETIKYFRQKLGIKFPFPDHDCRIPNVFCSPLYIMKLYKLTKHICNARDFGPVRQITKQPLKGRAKSGGSRIGQMEIEAILAHGCEKAVKEFMTVKSDWAEGKRDFLRQLIETGDYNLPEDGSINSQTKQVVDVQIEFLKS